MKQLFTLIFTLCLVQGVWAQLSLQNNITTYTINFDDSVSGVNSGGFTGSGFTTNPSSGQLDADAWATSGLSDGSKGFGTTNTSGDHARGSSSGGVSTGGIYSFDLGGTNYALGIQPTGSDWTPGTISLRIVNNSSSVINDMDIAYLLYVRNDQGRSNSFNFSYSVDNVSYTGVSSANYTSPQTAGSTAWASQSRNIQLTNLGINPGEFFYLRWAGSDVGGSGSRDEFALDDIVITAAGATNPCTEPSAQPTSLTFGTITSNSIQASFAASNADKFLVVQSTNASLGSAPVDGTIYNTGNSIGSGEVLQFSNSTSINSLGLVSNTTYYYFIYASNDNCSGGPDYRTLNPLTGSATTSSGGTNYYDGIESEICADLKTALHNLINGHTEVSYASLWTHYQTTDDRLNDSGTATIVWDMYSDNPGGSENEFTFITDQCGTYQGEGDCYNREHTFPRSWWGGSTSVPQYTDIFTVIPADGSVNGTRSNNPYGEVQSGTETTITNNGSALGSSSISIPGYNGSVFEPIDAYKGDLARGYFYMATRYEDVIASWETNSSEVDAVLDGTSYPVFEPWLIDMLISWHNADPVDQKELDRNEAIYGIQGNRNPFIDHPEYVALIWSNCGTGGDTQAPTTPSSLAAGNIGENSVDLSWTAATDNVGVTGYRVYQDDIWVGSTTSTSYTATSLSASTMYDFYVTAYDAAGNESGTSNTVMVTTTSPPVSNILHEGYFESGWDGWQDGGSDCARYSGSNSPEGSFSIRIRDNSGTASAMTSPVFDLSSYSTIDVDFSFYARSMENNEDFWLRYFDGSSWQTIATFTRGTDFQNGIFYNTTVSIDNASYNFPTNAQFRFQCDASGNNDQIYIDAVVITADQGSSALQGTAPTVAQTSTRERSSEPAESAEEEMILETATISAGEIVIYPNPASNVVNVDLSEYLVPISQIQVFNMLSQEVIHVAAGNIERQTVIDVSRLQNGFYILRILDSNNEITPRKIQILH